MTAAGTLRVLVVRHGIAVDRDAPEAPADDLRPLTDEGIRRSERAFAGLRLLGERVRAIRTSPLVRARETARLLARALRVPARGVRVAPWLRPGSDPAAALAAMGGLPAGVDTVALVGHAPDLDLLVAALVGAPRPVTALRKAGVAVVEVPRGRTAEGILVAVHAPRALRALAR